MAHPHEGLLADLFDKPTDMKKQRLQSLIIREEIALQAALTGGGLDALAKVRFRAAEIERDTPKLHLDYGAARLAKRHLRVTEYHLGKELRLAQNDGRLLSREEGSAYGAAVRDAKRNGTPAPPKTKPGIGEYAEHNELFGKTNADGYRAGGIWDFVDDVDEEMFHKALMLASNENNLSRSNVARYARELKNPTPAVRSKFRIVGKVNTNRQIQILDNVQSSLTAGISVLDSAFSGYDIEKTLTPQLARKYAREYRKAWSGISQTVKKLEEYGGTNGDRN